MRCTTLITAIALSAGAAYASAPTPDQIEADLLQAISAQPDDASSMLRLGIHLQSLGRLDDGESWIKAAYDANPQLISDMIIDTPTSRGGTVCPSATGPDVIVGSVSGMFFAAHSGPAQNGISAYGIGTTSCNVGDEILLWQSGNSNHPVIAQNIYRLKDGRFSQIGVGWLKHGFTALSGNICCTCTGGGGSQLSPGCSDPYSAGLNAGQSRLGPRFEINAATGGFPYPFTSPSYTSGSIDRRCQVNDSDVNPALNAGARFFAEGHYIANDDSAAGNDLNNASYIEINFSASGSGFGSSTIGSTVREIPAIKAWETFDPNATVVDVDVPDDGRFHVGFAATDNGDGTWRYEYAVHNLNSDRSAQALTIPVPASVNVTNAGFSDVTYHSGEPMDGTDWTFNRVGDNATWTTDAFGVNEMANALRWGTLYNFWFDADAPPATNDATITLFKPAPARGVPSVAVALSAPAGPACPADLNGSGAVDSGDLADLLAQWGTAGSADFNSSGNVGAEDLATLLAAWGPCP